MLSIKNLYKIALVLVSIIWLSGCKESEKKDDFIILQLNDVYEMSGVKGGTLGGLPRVQTLLKKLRKENPNTITMLAGDLFSPSAIGIAEKDGKRFAGRQMVALLNAMDWDYLTFGNHEFDIPLDELQVRE